MGTMVLLEKLIFRPVAFVNSCRILLRRRISVISAHTRSRVSSAYWRIEKLSSDNGCLT